MEVFFALVGAVYLVLLICLFMGWEKATSQELPFERNSPARMELSVIVPVRNEAHNLPNLLSTLLQQHYPNFEVIVVDDHSEDGTGNVARKITDPRVNVLTNSGYGKKSAITTGVDSAGGEIIVCTDADCAMNPEWLQAIANDFHLDQVKFSFGAVALDGSKSIFSRMQAVEFASLIGTAAASWALGSPTMCNGANIAFRKEVFNEVKGYEGNIHIPSGDDEFLMRKVLQKYPNGAHFDARPTRLVTSSPMDSLSSFAHQRLRWAAKWRFNSSIKTICLAVFILVSQFATLYFVYRAFAGDTFFFFLFFAKIVGEGIFLFRVCTFLKIPWSWALFFIVQAIYPFYVILIGVFANFISPRWKGRES